MQNLREPRRADKSQDEVEIAVLFDYIRGFFHSIYRGIAFMVHAIVANLVLVLSFVAVGAAIGYGIYYTTQPFYSSSMTLLLSQIRNEFVEDQFDKLTEMVGEGNYEAVASRLDITSEAAKQIRSLSFTNLDKDRVSEDSILTGSPFRVQLSLYDAELFPLMEPAITSYLENNQYFSKQKLIKQRQLTDMVAKLKNEIDALDSLKSEVVVPRGPVNGFVYGQPIDPTNLSKQSIELYEKQVELQSKLEQLDNIQVVTGFVPQTRPTGPLLLKHMLTGAGIAFLFGFLIALIYESMKTRRLA